MVVSSVLLLFKPLLESEGGCRHFTESVLFCVREAVGSEVTLSEAWLQVILPVVLLLRSELELRVVSDVEGQCLDVLLVVLLQPLLMAPGNT